MKKILFFLLPVVVLGCVKEKIMETAAPEGPFFPLTHDEAKLMAERDMPVRLAAHEIDRIIGDVVSLMEEAAPASSVPATHSAAGRNVGGQNAAAPNGTGRNGDGDGDGHTIAGRTIAEISPITLSIPMAVATANATVGSTRAEASRDTLFHVVNFADRRGYCIIAADRRIPDEIVCFVEHGSFPSEAGAGSDAGAAARTVGAGHVHPSEQAIRNPGLALMMDATKIYALRSLARHEVWRDSVEKVILTRTEAPSLDALRRSETPSTSGTRVEPKPYAPSWYIHRKAGPLLPVEWGQTAPFNATVVENTSWRNTPVGCVALATVQVMAYWKHPVNYHELADGNIDWQELRRWSGTEWDREGRYEDWVGPMSEAPDQTRKLIADILWHLGSDTEMRYSPFGSSAYTYKALNMLEEHGYSTGDAKSYSTESVMNSIAALRPVIIDGVSHLTDDGKYYANAHAWVIDGYLEQRWWDTRVIDRRLYEIERLRGFFHSNFGWDGVDNGWYACGVFDANNGPHLPSDTDWGTNMDTGIGTGTGMSMGTSMRTETGTRSEWQGDDYNYQFMLAIYPDIHK